MADETERPKDWISITEVTDEMLEKEKNNTPKKEVVDENVVEDKKEEEAPTEEVVVSVEQAGPAPVEEEKVADMPADGDGTEPKEEESEIIYSSGGKQPFTVTNTVTYTVANTAPTPVIANLEPYISDGVPEEDIEHDNKVADMIVHSYKGILVVLGAIIAVIMIYNVWLSPYEIKPNYAPETAPYERTPGDITRDQLDPRTHFPRKEEVIRHERRERDWNDMNIIERIWWWFFGDDYGY